MRLALFGAAPDTPNMGVSALFMSAIAGISKHIDSVEFVVFDNGLGRRDETITIPGGKEIPLIRFGARGGRRYYRPENLATMLLASRMGTLGRWANEGIRLIDSSTAVLDVSGGDSFSDIYGRERFDNICRPKIIAINRGIPLILLPQTYGPYNAQDVRAHAASAVKGASMVWARDSDSYENLKVMLGENFNPNTHHCGVDMAFALPASPASHLLPARLNDWLEIKSDKSPLVGFNVSGLIYNDPEGARSKYGFKAEYREVVVGYLNKLLTETASRLVLISHVMDQPGHYESDLAACQDVAKRLGESYSGRIVVAPSALDQSQAKWLISKMDWFCGTRMHSTIAGLSSCVTTAAVSYSDKTRGVFATCGLESQVFDPRLTGTKDIILQLWGSFNLRKTTNELLTVKAESVKQQAEFQMMQIASRIKMMRVPTCAG